MRYRQDYTLYRRKMKDGVAVWYYRTYDEYGSRTTGRSTGQTNKTNATKYCNELLRLGELVPIRDISFNNYTTDWWIWERCSYIRSRLARSPADKLVKSRTHAREMRSVLDQYLLPTFGRLRLSNITPPRLPFFTCQRFSNGSKHPGCHYRQGPVYDNKIF
jgi:hypothetical protein